MKKIVLLTLAMIILLTGCGTKRLDDPAQIMKKVQDKYEKAASIQVNMESDYKFQSNNVKFKGNTIIKAPDKYFSKVNVKSDAKNKKDSVEMVVTSISDGKNLWKITELGKEKPTVEKTPLAKDYFKDNVNYSVFKDIDLKNKNYKLLRSEKQNSIYYYVMELKEGTTRNLLWINGDDWTIDKTEVYADGSEFKPQDPVAISSYKNYIFNGKISDNQFNYTPPKGVKVNPAQYKS